jgi:hypothetical protein
VTPILKSSDLRKVKRSFIAFVGICSAALIFSACGNATVNHSMKDGHGVVVGRLLISPPMGSIVPTSGTVTFGKQGPAHSSTTFNVGSSGRFMLDLSPGLWIVTGRSPKFGDSQGVCVTSHPVDVTANHRLSISVECLEK